MEYFKKWLKLTEIKIDNEEKLFAQRDITQKSNISKFLGFKKPLIKYKQGSIATLYQHPYSEKLLIKVTSHKQDVKNIVKAQNLNSSNVVKTFPWDNMEMIKKIPSLNSFSIIVEKINGASMIYTTSEFFDLSLNGKFELASDWLESTVHKQQKYILDSYNKNNSKEHMKLSNLFKTLHQLEHLYRIELSDFQDNILDDGNRYVIVDMGF